MARERVVECTFPVYRDGNFRDREAVPVVDIEPMQDWDFLALKVPATHKLMGYAKAELPAVPSYVALELDRSYRRGAATEQGIRGTLDMIGRQGNAGSLIEICGSQGHHNVALFPPVRGPCHESSFDVEF